MVTPARQAAIEDTDAQLALLVDELETAGAWDETVLMFTSDHGMDWGPQNQSVGLESALNAAGYTNDDSGAPGESQAGSQGDYQVVGGGGSGTIYVEDEEDLADIAQLVSALPGVDFIATREPVAGALHRRHTTRSASTTPTTATSPSSWNRTGTTATAATSCPAITVTRPRSTPCCS